MFELVSVGPSSVSLTGGEDARPGEEVSLTCVTDHSLPASDVSWSVADHEGRHMHHLIQANEILPITCIIEKMFVLVLQDHITWFWR